MTDKMENKTTEVKQDNWQGRAQGMKCITCIWFCPKKGALGRCRKHAPGEKGWVPVYETDWCGDHRIDENKI